MENLNNGEWKMENLNNGEWKMENGKLKMGNVHFQLSIINFQLKKKAFISFP